MDLPRLDFSRFACPVHKRALKPEFRCADGCEPYPVVNGIPVLINEANSVFNTSDYLGQRGYGGASAYAGALDKRTGLRQVYRRAMMRITRAAPATRDFSAADALRHVAAAVPDARALVVGAGESRFGGDVIHTDVAFGKNVQCIADAHDLPFEDASFDACVIVAVLEHVVDPHRCVEEIRRVLKPGGYVYAETPFMQPVHMGAHDFTRFSHLGHRRLFRHFSEIRSGMIGGPGASAAQMMRYALVSLSDHPRRIKWLKLIGLLMARPLRWLDHPAKNHKAAFDAASAFYFFGSLAAQPLSDRALLKLYHGADNAL